MQKSLKYIPVSVERLLPVARVFITEEQFVMTLDAKKPDAIQLYARHVREYVKIVRAQSALNIMEMILTWQICTRAQFANGSSATNVTRMTSHTNVSSVIRNCAADVQKQQMTCLNMCAVMGTDAWWEASIFDFCVDAING